MLEGSEVRRTCSTSFAQAPLRQGLQSAARFSISIAHAQSLKACGFLPFECSPCNQGPSTLATPDPMRNLLHRPTNSRLLDGEGSLSMCGSAQSSAHPSSDPAPRIGAHKADTSPRSYRHVNPGSLTFAKLKALADPVSRFPPKQKTAPMDPERYQIHFFFVAFFLVFFFIPFTAGPLSMKGHHCRGESAASIFSRHRLISSLNSGDQLAERFAKPA